MSATELLDRLSRRGVRLWLDGERLRFTASRGSLTETLRAEIDAGRAEIVALLREAPLSSAQRQLWFLEALSRDSGAYVLAGIFRLRGEFDAARFQTALDRLVQRHDVLRTSFRQAGGEPYQHIAETAHVPMSRQNAAGRADAERLADAFVRRPFDLSRAPLLRAAEIVYGAAERLLALAIHHIIADEWSVGILLRELSALYEGGGQASLPALKSTYACYAAEQRRIQDTDEARSGCRDLASALRPPLPVLALPTSAARPAVQDFSGNRVRRIIPDADMAAIGRLCRDEGVTPFMVFLTAYLLVLARHAGQDELAVGTVVAGRNRSGLEDLVGCFVNTLVLRADISGAPTFRAVLRRVRELWLAAYSHADVPFERLVEAVAEPRDASRSPLFQAAIVLENAPSGALALRGASVETVEAPARGSKFDLTLVIAERAGRTSAFFDYATALFSASAMNRMLGHFVRMLGAGLRDPDLPHAEHEMVSASEHAMLASFERGAPSKIAGPVLLHELFVEQARLTPDAVALRMGEAHLTYRELDRRSEAIAGSLIARRIGPGDVVGLCLSRSPDMVAALLGVLKAGAAYLPLDTDYPRDRLAHMIGETGAKLVLADALSASSLAGTFADAKVVLLTELRATDEPRRSSNGRVAQEGDIACIVYTSGSTGRPKGVVLGHAGLCNLALAQIELFAITAESRVLQFASLSFDAAASEIFTALLAGATLVLATRELLLTGLGSLLEKERISVVTLPPAVLCVLPPRRLPELATLVVAGEACPVDLAHAWSEGRRFLNAYGPAEASVCATVGVYAAGASSLPIGRPLPGVDVRILDRDGKRVPVGVTGELHISGVCLSHGYCRQPGLTAERFRANDGGEVLYATGDLGCWREDGQIEYQGRRDGQIKLRGMRVEPAEIEAALCAHPDIAQAAVVAGHDVGAGTQLLGFFVPRVGARPAPGGELRAWLKERLPAHMVPALLQPLAALPLNPNGKIDRRRLPSAAEVDWPVKPVLAPRDDTEIRLLQIWEQVLPGRPFGIRENFFDIGGHSLLAVKLLAAVEQCFGRAVSLTDMLAHPTIEAMAVLLRRENVSTAWSPLVELRRSGSGIPFFCVHPLGGNVAGYLPLARRLPPQQGFHALQAPGLEAGTAVCARVEDLAALYLAAIDATHPEIRIRLGGHSFGGLVAFEMALQLRRRGRAVDRLVLMDTPAPVGKNRPAPIASTGEWLRRRVRVLEAFHGVDIGLAADAFDALPEPDQIAIFLEAMRKSDLLPRDAGRDLVTRLLAVQQASHEAAAGYVPSVAEPYPDPIVLIRASDREQSAGREADAHAFSDSLLDWQAFVTGPIHPIAVPGDHISMLREPHVQAVAAALTRAFA